VQNYLRNVSSQANDVRLPTATGSNLSVNA